MSAPKKINVFQAAAIYKINQWKQFPYNYGDSSVVGLRSRDRPFKLHFGANHFIPVAARYFGVHRATIYRVINSLGDHEFNAAGHPLPSQYDQIMANPAAARWVTRWFRKLVKYYVKQKECLRLEFREWVMDTVRQFPAEMWEALYQLKFTHRCTDDFIMKVAKKLGQVPDHFVDVVCGYASCMGNSLILFEGCMAVDRTKLNAWKIKCAEWGGAWALADILRGDHPSVVKQDEPPLRSKKFRLPVDAVIPPAGSKGDAGHDGEKPPARSTAVA